MDLVEKKLETQVQFWSLLGPFFVLLSSAVLLFKVSSHWYFPISALVGIPLCMKWKMKGMAAALCCLFLLAGINYQTLDLDDRYWHVGLSLAMAFSFIVLTLSLEEVKGLVDKLQLESDSRLNNFLLLDEKWKNAEQEWVFEKEKSKGEIGTLTHELAQTQEDKQTFYKLAQLAKDELVQVRSQHDLLLQDLFYKKQQIAQLQERLEETELTIQGFVNSDSENQIIVLTEHIACLEQEKETFHVKMALAQKEQQTCHLEIENLKQELQAYQEREKICFQEKQEQQNVLQMLQSRYACIEQEREVLLSAQVQLQQQYEQMRLLEIQYRQATQQSQYKIQDLEGKLLEGEKQKEALQLRRREMEEQVLYQDRQAKQREECYKNSLEQLQLQLKEQRHQEEIKFNDFQQKSTSEIKALQEVLQFSQKELLDMHDQLGTKHAVLLEMQEKVDNLSLGLQEQQLLVNQSAEKNQKLESLKAELEQALKETQEQLQKMKKQQEENQSMNERLPYASGNTRQIESIYLQLKEQFQEKSNVLEATRRELFHANEEILKYRKKYEEEHVFSSSVNERRLQRYIIRLGGQFERAEKLYQQEIDELTQLIGDLLQQMNLSVK